MQSFVQLETHLALSVLGIRIYLSLRKLLVRKSLSLRLLLMVVVDRFVSSTVLHSESLSSCLRCGVRNAFPSLRRGVITSLSSHRYSISGEKLPNGFRAWDTPFGGNPYLGFRI